MTWVLQYPSCSAFGGQVQLRARSESQRTLLQQTGLGMEHQRLGKRSLETNADVSVKEQCARSWATLAQMG